MNRFSRPFVCLLSIFAGFLVAAIILPDVRALEYRTTLIVVALANAFSLLVYGVLTSRSDSEAIPRETCCRKCSHILRDLSEPTCPQCGERI